MTRIVILGGGTAGTIVANRLARRYRRDIAAGRTAITVVDQDNCHVYQPGLLFVPFGIYDQRDVMRPRNRQLAAGVEYVQTAIERVEPDRDVVRLVDGRAIAYDVLVVATGVTTAPEETEGMTGPGWREKVFDFYTVEGATALRGALERFEGGRLVVSITDMPIKCPVAPLEFAFLADAYFTERGIRDRVTITYVTPLDSAFTKPVCSRHLTYLLRDKGIELVTEFNTGSVDGAAGSLRSYDEREVPFDLLVTVPLHAGAAWVERSDGLGDGLRFVTVDQHTLQAERKPNIFALGDASNVPTSKAGSVAHFQAEVLEGNVARFLEGRPLEPAFDGHANCFIETGHGKALLIDFNYDVQPLPGHFPIPRLGPMSLLKESRINHWGKLAFRWIYWNLLLPGRDMPLVSPQMTMRGKHGFAEAGAADGEPVAV
jgi:sulfide:quinone oxidoreductase